MALRPRESPSSIASRYGQQALAEGLRPGGGSGTTVAPAANPAPKSVIGSLAGFGGNGSGVAPLAGFIAAESGITSLGGFAGDCRPQPPGGRKAILEAFKYAAAVSRRTPVFFWIRRSDQPNRPRAMTCCFFSSFKTLLTSPRVSALGSELTSWTAVYRWPVFR